MPRVILLLQDSGWAQTPWKHPVIAHTWAWVLAIIPEAVWMAAHLTPRRAPADAAKPTLSDGAGSAPGAAWCKVKWYKPMAIGAPPLIHAQRRGEGMGTTCSLWIYFDWLEWRPPALPQIWGNLCKLPLFIRAVQRWTAWNPLTGEAPAPSGSCLA